MEDLNDNEFCYVFQSPGVHEEHLIKQKFVGQNCWNFSLVSKILFDEILSDKVSFFAVPLVKHVLEEIISGATFSTRSAKQQAPKLL